jgi:hypothetical protein
MERTKAVREGTFEEKFQILIGIPKRNQKNYRNALGFFTRKKKDAFLVRWLLQKAREELQFYPIPVPRSVEAKGARKRLMVIFEIFAFIAPTAPP